MMIQSHVVRLCIHIDLKSPSDAFSMCQGRAEDFILPGGVLTFQVNSLAPHTYFLTFTGGAKKI